MSVQVTVKLSAEDFDAIRAQLAFAAKQHHALFEQAARDKNCSVRLHHDIARGQCERLLEDVLT